MLFTFTHNNTAYEIELPITQEECEMYAIEKWGSITPSSANNLKYQITHEIQELCIQREGGMSYHSWVDIPLVLRSWPMGGFAKIKARYDNIQKIIKKTIAQTNREILPNIQPVIQPIVQQANTNNTCSICMENPITTAIIPCGHTFCSNCIHTTNTCHICRVQIGSKLRIFI